MSAGFVLAEEVALVSPPGAEGGGGGGADTFLKHEGAGGQGAGGRQLDFTLAR